MASQSKSEAARANGAKSHGPTTPEGKARSSRNALTHGLTADFHALPGESEEALEDLIAAHRDLHQPESAIEEDLVRSLAITRWRLARIAVLETHLFENELCLSEQKIDEQYAEIEDMGRLAFVFQKLADRGQALALLMRYESSLTRVYDRTFKHLLAIQKLRNEPKPPDASAGSDENPVRQVPDLPSSEPRPSGAVFVGRPRIPATVSAERRHGTPGGMRHVGVERLPRKPRSRYANAERR